MVFMAQNIRKCHYKFWGMAGVMLMCYALVGISVDIYALVWTAVMVVITVDAYALVRVMTCSGNQHSGN